MLVEHEVDIVSKLKSVFGYNQFRGEQESIIHNVLEGRNTFVIMPTGAGKSLCYQLPAISLPGTALVISPLIALMKNQVDQLNALGINAHFLNSTLTKGEVNKLKKEIMSGDVKLLYIAPESLAKEETLSFLKKAQVSFVAIDEAHCISEWGHDFRPEYRRIHSIIEELGNIPVIALTATATPKVQLDIQKNLQMEEASLFKTSFNRRNLFYEVRAKKDHKKEIIRFVKARKGQSGIIYCLSRKKVEEIAELLRVNDVKALPYHAGLDAQVRMANQDAFLNEEVEVIVATIAFGMGIDKPDVRFVIHYDTPKSLEGYYQETGRGGRDGLDAHCLMFYRYKDIVKLEKFNKDKSVTERDNAKHLLEEMAAYAESSVCRRKQLLHYFGEHMEKDCGYCDNCKKPHNTFEAKDEVVLALKAVEQTEERFDMHHLSHVLEGINNDYVESYRHDLLEVYGKGKNYSSQYWTSLYRQALLMGFLEKDIDNYGVLLLTDRGRDYIIEPYTVKISENHDYESDATDEDDEAPSGPGFDPALFESLKALRRKVAKEKGVPPYVVFQDPSLQEMATVYPTTREDLSHINGVGMGKVMKFGTAFIDFIKKYVDENDIVTANDVVIKSSVNKSKTKIFIIQQIDKKVELEDIASAKAIPMQNVIEEIEHICYSGTKLNLDYYINQVIDQDKQDEIYDYFMSAETDNIEAAINELGDDLYSEDEIRLMRIKFMSEVAL